MAKDCLCFNIIYVRISSNLATKKFACTYTKAHPSKHTASITMFFFVLGITSKTSYLFSDFLHFILTTSSISLSDGCSSTTTCTVITTSCPKSGSLDSLRFKICTATLQFQYKCQNIYVKINNNIHIRIYIIQYTTYPLYSAIL